MIKNIIFDLGGVLFDEGLDVVSKVLNEDGTAKVKLIAGSLSKSYQFNVDDAEKALFAKE